MTVNNSSISGPVTDRADYDIFISYSRRDKDFVRQLWEALAQANQDAWVDWDDIPPTADWRQEIYRGIEAANNFVFVISPNSISSVVCGEELLHAIKHGKRLVSIVRQDVDYQAVHPELAKLNWIFFREIDDFKIAVGTLIEAIETDLSHVRAHTRLLVRAREWENKEHDSSFLLRGSDLKSAEQWLTQSASKQPQSTALHREYIDASRKAETERQEVEIRLHRLTPQQYRNRQALLNKVRNYWVKGVLETSLHNRVLIELSLEERPQAIAHPWNLTLETVDEPQKLLPHGTKLIDLFDSIGEGRTLLILGNPGSGKTTTLLELTRDLVANAEQDIGQPIPVVFNLSSWGGEKQTISDWLVKELNTKYQVPKQVGQGWVKNQQLLLLLDGLDEVPTEYREACIVALNAFHQEYGSEIVVASRIKDYEALSNCLNFQSAVYLRSLTLEQIFHSLEGADSYLEGLRALLLKDEMLRELAKSPLMLNIMAMAYQEVAVEDLSETGLLEERRTQLLDAYIEQMFKRRGSDQYYSKAQTMYWLSWLARRMSQWSQTVFLIEWMQPEWLQTQAQHRLYRIGVKLLLATIWGSLHVGLLAGLRDSALPFNVLKGLQGLIYGLIGGVIYGLIGGSIGGLVNDSTNRLVGGSINGLLLGLIYGPIFGWVYGSMGGITYGLIYGLIGVILYELIHNSEEIESVSILKWSWRKARNYSVFGIIIGLVLHFGTHEPLIPSLIFGLMLSLILGFERVNEVEVDRRTVPNQSIWKSAANAAKLFLTIGLPTGLILAVIVSPIYGLVNGLLYGLASGLLGGRGAGITCIKHFTLRCILWRSGYIPWDYAQFLDYASDRIFLQKVGGGYVFIHRLMLEHFAQIELKPVHR
jgi:MFS family permease/energy-coupling factor transporter ATP-binding protein EcfA2